MFYFYFMKNNILICIKKVSYFKMIMNFIIKIDYILSIILLTEATLKLLLMQ